MQRAFKFLLKYLEKQMRKIIFFISSLTIIFVSKFFWKIIKGSHQGVIRQSLNSHYIGIIEQPSNSHPAVIKQSVDRHQAVIGKSWGSHWASESSRQSSGSHQTVRQSSGSHGQSLPSHPTYLTVIKLLEKWKKTF